MNRKQVAFITCVNDEAEYAECKYYLERLSMPEGYERDIISIREAPSMAAGYNAGMKSSNAKYKVYLHQDVFIRNIYFLKDMLNIFMKECQIGLLGMIGKKNWEMVDGVVSSWDTGKLLDNEMIWNSRIPSKNDSFAEVQSVDGLLLATQYDIPWREDIFDGWDFYDHSQCMEFRKAGYKVAVPWQETPWCYHDDIYSNMTSYFDYYTLFLKEYAGMPDFPANPGNTDGCMYSEQKTMAQGIEEMRAGLAELMTAGMKTELRKLFQDPLFQSLRAAAEYRLVVSIDWQEEQNHTRLRLWESGMSASQLILKLRKLKYALKRMEYGADDLEKEKSWLRENYSEYAIINAVNSYVIYKDIVYDKFDGFLQNVIY